MLSVTDIISKWEKVIRYISATGIHWILLPELPKCVPGSLSGLVPTRSIQGSIEKIFSERSNVYLRTTLCLKFLSFLNVCVANTRKVSSE